MVVPLPSPDAAGPVVLDAVLPGPGRKRTEAAYVYRLQYLSPDLSEAGCLMVWEVEGGRLPYQIAVERAEDGRLRCHCTCADAIYRAEAEGRVCKHVRGFLTWSPPEERSDDALLRRGA